MPNKNKRKAEILGSQEGQYGREYDYESVGNPGNNVVRARNVRESSIAYLYARDQITQDQRNAADRYQRDCDLASVGPISAPDLARVPMDTKGGYRDLSDGRIDAISRVNEVRSTLSKVTIRLLDLICVSKLSIQDAAQSIGQARDYVGWRLREALDDLSSLYQELDSREAYGLARMKPRLINVSETAPVPAHSL